MTDLEGKAKQFFIVSAEILPEAIVKTAYIKEILARGEAETVNEAVEKVGLSRSAFYKYKDGVFPFYEASREKIVTIYLLLEHQAGVLSHVLNTVAEGKGNVLTINQGLPLQGMANVTISIDTTELLMPVDELLSKLQAMPRVKKAEIVGQS